MGNYPVKIAIQGSGACIVLGWKIAEVGGGRKGLMEERVRITDSEKLTLLYERFRDVCLVEKEVWKEIFMPRDVAHGPVRTNIQDRYEVEIDDPQIEDALETNITLGAAALWAAVQEYREHIRFYRMR
ncbi:MAG: hypothetical protein CV088_04565 [Nitrospira sp. LK70]|nr:hypothetical protein [Nitrospira sp. LK70]